MATACVLYDNKARPGLWVGWGFSAYLRVGDHAVVFDTGADRLVLEHNARQLSYDLSSVDCLVLSHEHCDHIGGVLAVLRRGISLYVPESLVTRFAGQRENGVSVLSVTGSAWIAPSVRSTGQFGAEIAEQALLVDGEAGPTLITGCAHEGIVTIVNRAMQIAGGRLALVLGGLHFYRQKEPAVRIAAEQLLELGIGQIAPCHCTGDVGISILREVFGDRFVDVGVGTTIDI